MKSSCYTSPGSRDLVEAPLDGARCYRPPIAIETPFGRTDERGGAPAEGRPAATGDLQAAGKATERGLALSVAWVGLTTLGLISVRVGQFALSDGIFLVVVAIVVAQLLSGSRNGLAPARSRRSSQLVLAGSVILLTAGTLSSFGSWDPTTSLLIAVRVAYLTLVWFWILRAVTPTRSALDTLLRGWRTGVLIVATAAVLDQIGLISISADNTEGRQTAFSGHPNDLAGYPQGRRRPRFACEIGDVYSYK